MKIIKITPTDILLNERGGAVGMVEVEVEVGFFKKRREIWQATSRHGVLFEWSHNQTDDYALTCLVEGHINQLARGEEVHPQKRLKELN